MFIDMHLHVAGDCQIPYGQGGNAFASPEELIEMLDVAGIDKGVIMPMISPEATMLVQSNESMLAVAEKYPDRFIPFCNIDPRLHRNSADTDLSFAINYYKDKGCRGIGEVTANLYLDDPRVHNLFRHAERCQMPIAMQFTTRVGDSWGLVDDFGFPRLEEAARQFPDLALVCHSIPWWAHISGDVAEHELDSYPKGPVVEGGRVVELMRKYPNIYGELSSTSGYNALSRDPEFGYWFLDEFQDQLFFATKVWAVAHRDDILLWLADFLREALAQGKITQQVFDKIAYKNAQRILKLEV